jgi:hypothetical protein
MALLIGQEGWYSSRCRLTWRLAGTKYNRLYFRLAVSMLRTKGIGPGLLPTVVPESRGKRSEDGLNKRHSMEIQDMAIRGLLPTPQSRDEKNGSKAEDGRIQRKLEQGWTIDLNDLAASGMLPTPTEISDAKGGCTRPDLKRQNDTLAHAIHGISGAPTGTTSQLNPLFVESMMGFPENWTVLPFLSGETKA